MSAAIIYERRDDFFLIYCRSGDYRIPVSDCDTHYKVGQWIAVYLSGSDIENYGILNLPDLPPVRVVNGKAEVLTSGTIAGNMFETNDFGSIPVLCRLPENICVFDIDVQIWVRRLSFGESCCFQGAKWGAVEIMCSDRLHSLNSHVTNHLETDVSMSLSTVHQKEKISHREDLGAMEDPLNLIEDDRSYTFSRNKVQQEPSSRTAVEFNCLNWRPRRTWKSDNEIKQPPHGGIPRDLQGVLPASELPRPSYNLKALEPDYLRQPKSLRLEKRTVPVVPKVIDLRRRQRVTALATVILFDGKKQRYIVWLLEYHQEADFYTSRTLQPAHFFQGRFAIGGSLKAKCHGYIQEIPALMDFHFDSENYEVELVVDVVHKNRKNGACYEVFNNYLGSVLDTKNILMPVSSEAILPVAVRRRPYGMDDEQRYWQIVDLR